MKNLSVSTTCIAAMFLGTQTLNTSRGNNFTSNTICYRKETQAEERASGQTVNNWLSNMSSTKKQNIEKKVQVKQVEDLLKNSLNKFNWRTVDGILQETKIPKEVIVNELKKMADEGLIFIGTKVKTDEKIYTFIKNYEKNTKLKVKFLDAIRGKIIR